MSESNRSSLLSDAGIQLDGVKARARLTIDRYASLTEGAALAFKDAMGNQFTASIDSTKTNEASTSDEIGYSGVNTAAKLARSLYGSIHHAITYGIAASTTGSASGGGNKLLMEVNYVAGSAVLHLTQSVAGPVGNNIKFTGLEMRDTAASLYVSVTGSEGGDTFSGGTGGAAPIIRGVLLAPSGVSLMLSSSTGDDASTMTPLSTTAGTKLGPFGTMTGSVNIRNGRQTFHMILNGHKGTGHYPNAITASFDTDAANYISNVFNTDPTKIEEAGHYLYTHYDVHTAVASLTGSGVLTQGATEQNDTAGAVTKGIFPVSYTHLTLPTNREV